MHDYSVPESIKEKINGVTHDKSKCAIQENFTDTLLEFLWLNFNKQLLT